MFASKLFLSVFATSVALTSVAHAGDILTLKGKKADAMIGALTTLGATDAVNPGMLSWEALDIGCMKQLKPQVSYQCDAYVREPDPKSSGIAIERDLTYRYVKIQDADARRVLITLLGLGDSLDTTSGPNVAYLKKGVSRVECSSSRNTLESECSVVRR